MFFFGLGFSKNHKKKIAFWTCGTGVSPSSGLKTVRGKTIVLSPEDGHNNDRIFGANIINTNYCNPSTNKSFILK